MIVRQWTLGAASMSMAALAFGECNKRGSVGCYQFQCGSSYLRGAIRPKRYVEPTPTQ